MKKVLVVFLAVMFLASVVESKMVDNQTNARTIQRIQRISQILDNARNQVEVEYAAIQADIAAYPGRYDPDDKTDLQTLASGLTTIKNEIVAWEAQKNSLFPDM